MHFLSLDRERKVYSLEELESFIAEYRKYENLKICRVENSFLIRGIDDEAIEFK